MLYTSVDSNDRAAVFLSCLPVQQKYTAQRGLVRVILTVLASEAHMADKTHAQTSH